MATKKKEITAVSKWKEILYSPKFHQATLAFVIGILYQNGVIDAQTAGLIVTYIGTVFGVGFVNGLAERIGGK